MHLYRKVLAVEKVFRRVDKAVNAFAKVASISCVQGCGICCAKKDIEATPLEFLPLAYHLHKEGRAMETVERLSSSPRDICIFLEGIDDDPKFGRCIAHLHRGLICRLFGFSGVVDRAGRIRFATCRFIKDRDEEHFSAVEAAVGDGKISIPVGSHYFLMLHSIDPDMTACHPINIAVKRSLETVLSYYAYRRRR